MIEAIGFALLKADQELIARMVKNILIDEVNIQDVQSFSLVLEDNPILVFGTKAFKQIANHPKLEQYLILQLPEVDQLKQRAENKTTRQKVTAQLQQFKERIEQRKANAGVLTNHSLTPNKLTLKLKNGQKILVGDIPGCDMLPKELLDILCLLHKLPCEEAEIEFVTNTINAVTRRDDENGDTRVTDSAAQSVEGKAA
jgi:hypothetical protein